MKYQKQKLGEEKAIELFNSKWWEGRSHRDIAKFQLFTEELCLPFGIFHEAIEKTLERPVYTHEFGLNYEGICMEFLGEKDAPSLTEIMDLIPTNKKIIILH